MITEPSILALDLRGLKTMTTFTAKTYADNDRLVKCTGGPAGRGTASHLDVDWRSVAGCSVTFKRARRRLLSKSFSFPVTFAVISGSTCIKTTLCLVHCAE